MFIIIRVAEGREYDYTKQLKHLSQSNISSLGQFPDGRSQITAVRSDEVELELITVLENRMLNGDDGIDMGHKHKVMMV